MTARPWLLLCFLLLAAPAHAEPVKLYWTYPATVDSMAFARSCPQCPVGMSPPPPALRSVWIFGYGTHPLGPGIFGSRWITPEQAGTKDSTTVNVWPGSSYWFQVVTRDAAGNPSGPSNAVGVRR